MPRGSIVQLRRWASILNPTTMATVSVTMVTFITYAVVADMTVGTVNMANSFIRTSVERGIISESNRGLISINVVTTRASSRPQLWAA
ncbi:Ff.00g064680.m01.CDS01 [Fusarium sp. VM40]|nr:Ff.00g064680.m01.CDS01 [Fusarium sp. VM40]